MNPDYERYIRDRFAQARVTDDPFPHLVIRDVLPPALYSEMEQDCPGRFRHMIAAACATRGRPLRRHWQQPTFAIRDGDATTFSLGRYADQWRDRYRIYVDLIDRLTIEAYQPAVDIFLSRLQRAGFIAAPAPLQVGQGIFTHRTEWWRIPPHVHASAQIIQSMIYFPLSGSTPEQGTVLYKLRRPKTVRAAELMQTYAFAADEVEQAGLMPYHPNTLASFLNTPISIHASPDVPGPARRYTFTAAVMAGVSAPDRVIDLAEFAA